MKRPYQRSLTRSVASVALGLPLIIVASLLSVRHSAARAQQSQIPPIEHGALVARYNSTEDAKWANPWTLSKDESCSLYGLTGEDGHVLELVLRHNHLNGSMPPEFGDLSNLERLRIISDEETQRDSALLSAADLLPAWSSAVGEHDTGPGAQARVSTGVAEEGYVPQVAVEISSPTGSWQTRANAPFVSMDSVYVGYEGKGYLVGGYGANGQVGIYDIDADTWTTGATEPTPQIDYPVDGCFGFNANGDPVTVLFNDATSGVTMLKRYNMATDSWDTPPVPTGFPTDGLWAHDIASLWPQTGENVCYISGGATTPGGGNTSALYAYYPDTNTVENLGVFTYHPVGFAFHASWYVPWVGSEGGICVGGGINADGVISGDTQCYDIGAGVFKATNADLGPMPAGLWGMADGILYEDGDYQLWVTYGVDSADDLWSNSAYYSLSSGQWHMGPTPPREVYRVEGVNIEAVDGCSFYVLGGSSGGFTPTSGHERNYSPDGPPDTMGQLHGYVLDDRTDEPVEADISIDSGDSVKQIKSDGDTGYYEASLYAGDYELAFSATGYLNHTDTVTIFAEEEVELDVSLVPDTSGILYLPLLLRGYTFTPDAPVLSAIENEDGDGSYTVSWTASDGAETYTLEEASDVGFSSPTTVYSGPDTSIDISGRDVGTYYYRVRAHNPYARSEWSNVESVEVTVPPPPCPQAGLWSGSTSQGRPISFEVVHSPECQIAAESLHIQIRDSCGFVTTTVFGQSHLITDNHFDTGSGGTARVVGDFSSSSAASGTFTFSMMHPFEPWRTCTASGTWTATP